MKLYSKQLNNLEALKREKHVMKYALKHSDDWLNIKAMMGKSDSTDTAAGAGLFGTLISAFGSKSLFNTIIAIAPPVLTLISKNSSFFKKRKNPLESIAKEVIGGYIKWKAVQLAYRGIMSLVKSNKDVAHEKRG